MDNHKAGPQSGSMDAMLKDAQRWAALRDNGWTLYEVQTEIRVANTTGVGPTYRKAFKHAGWTLSCLSGEEFDTQDEAIDEAIRRFVAPLKSDTAPSATAAPEAPETRYPLHEDRIQEVANEFQMELMHCGVESFVLERMVREAVAYAEKEEQDELVFPAARPLDKDVVRELAREYQGELLSNGVEAYYLKKMIRAALALAYLEIPA